MRKIDKAKYWVDTDRLRDPRFWFLKAHAYASSCEVIWKECGSIVYVDENPTLTINAIRATPYLTAIASELFMKGYLIYKGIKNEQIRKLDHNLEKIRETCVTFGDRRFDDNNLKFLTETCGEQLMEDGGIRYPDKKDMVAFPEFKTALDILEEISGEVLGVLPSKQWDLKSRIKNQYYKGEVEV